MTVTVVITKTKLALSILLIALLAPATALAVDSWSDTKDGEFYHDAVTWAKVNGMTTGCNGGTGFCPDRGVTRGENITFAHRYDTLVVQPVLADLTAEVAAISAAIAANTADIEALDTSQSFAVTVHAGSNLDLTTTPTAAISVMVTAPVAGHVTVNSTARASHSVDGGDIDCVIVESTDIPGIIQGSDEAGQVHETGGLSNESSLSGTRTFAIAAGSTITYVLACEEAQNGSTIRGRNLTAIFTPAP